MWNLMDTTMEEQKKYQNVTSRIAASESEITVPNILSVDLLNDVEAEVSKLEQLKSIKLKEILLKKKLELEEVCRQSHMVTEILSAAEYSNEAIESGAVDPACLLEQIELQIARAKEEALSRKEILEKIEKWLAACQEESWLEEYNRDDNRYTAGRGAHITLKRAKKVRVLVNKIPGMVETLTSKATAWEKESDCLLVNPWRLYSYHPHQSFAVPLLTLTQTKKQQKLTLFSSSKTRTRALPFDLSPPPIDHDLLDTVAATAGAKVSDDGIIETFDNDDQALDAVDNGVAVVDLSHFCRIRVSGEDRIQFLHNQSTANFECLDEGQGCDTVFVTPTARTIDIAHAWVMKNAVMLMVSPVSRSISEMLNKYIFFNDKVEIQDITKQTCFFVLVGPKSNQLMEELNLGDLVGQPYGTHQHFSVNGMPVTVGVGNVISEKGFSLLMSPAAAGSVWKTILSQGATPMGSNAWEKLRILQGKPAPQKELTNEYNVLEAGLWNSISLSKGCYKGQETISRLITYDGVKQRLWGISLSAPAEPGSIITVGGKKVGKLTSCTSGRKESEYFGLGYIKRQNVSEGDTVMVGDAITGTVVEVPFLAGQRPPSRSSSS